MDFIDQLTVIVKLCISVPFYCFVIIFSLVGVFIPREKNCLLERVFSTDYSVCPNHFSDVYLSIMDVDSHLLSDYCTDFWDSLSQVSVAYFIFSPVLCILNLQEQQRQQKTRKRNSMKKRINNEKKHGKLKGER